MPPAIYVEAADLIADKYANSPDISHFCEGLGRGGRWAVAYERHMRAILKVNHDRFVRCSAYFSLATLVQLTSEDRQTEAEELFTTFLKDFDGEYNYHGLGIEQQYRLDAQRQLDELRSRALGMPAPEIDGVDIYDKPMKLSDFRGRVVLMSFWATWCYPCMKFIPHEVELAKSLEGQPFQIVGVNSDSEITKAQNAVEKTKMTWRSFRDIMAGKELISKQWRIVGYPTFYLIDHHGMIRRRWIGYPPVNELTHATCALVDAAKRNVPLAKMQQVVSAMTMPTAEPTMATLAPSPSLRMSGFIEKVYRAPDGIESKYVIFVPRTYDGSKPFPLILFLHGSGSRGTDGQLPIKHGLAKAIRARMRNFLFSLFFRKLEKVKTGRQKVPAVNALWRSLVRWKKSTRLMPIESRLPVYPWEEKGRGGSQSPIPNGGPRLCRSATAEKRSRRRGSRTSPVGASTATPTK